MGKIDPVMQMEMRHLFQALETFGRRNGVEARIQLTEAFLQLLFNKTSLESKNEFLKDVRVKQLLDEFLN